MTGPSMAAGPSTPAGTTGGNGKAGTVPDPAGGHQEFVAAVRELTAQVTELTERLASLEQRMDAAHPAGEISDETLLVIAAAVAAFLGKRATVRQVHLRRHTTWAKQGRADVQHSHLPRTLA